MKSHSLRLRLVLGAGVGIAAALILAGLAIGYLFVASVERGARADLSATMARLVALVNPGSGGDAPVLTGLLPDARYATPLGGVYWQVADLDRGGLARSRSLWDHVLEIRPAEGDQFITTEGPGGQSVLAEARTVRFPVTDGGRRYQVVVAQDRSILDEAIARFGRDLAIALLILGLMLVLAAFLQVQIGLASLGKLRQDIEAVRKGKAKYVRTAYPSEVLPLIGEVNGLLSTQQMAVEFARSRAADLAHGLKTPLAVLGTLEHELASRGETKSAALIAELTVEMVGRIDYQMRLVRLNQRTRLDSLNASLSLAVERAISVLRRTREGERLVWRVEVAPDLNVDIDGNDLIELVGIVLENASQWAAGAIYVRATRNESGTRLEVDDDGPGVHPSQIDSIGVRGRRLDETSPGTGLGLAIAREIVKLNKGALAFAISPLGGLSVRIDLLAAR